MVKIEVDIKINDQEIEKLIRKRVRQIMAGIIREEVSRFKPWLTKYKRDQVIKDILKKEGYK